MRFNTRFRLSPLINSIVHLVMIAVASAQTSVVPGSLQNLEGQGASAGFAVNFRLQQLYSSTLFPNQVMVIKEIRFRPDVTYAVGPFSGTLSDIRFTLSTTTRSTATMSSVFSENLSGDAVEVYSGSWNVFTAFEGPFVGPKKFDVSLPLQKPFRYDPSLGNLLMEYRNFSSLSQRFHTDSASIGGGPVRMIFSDGDPNALTATAGSDGADVIEIVWTAEEDALPFFTSQPKDQIVSEGGTASFNVAAMGHAPMSYQWYRDGAVLPGEESASLSLSNLAQADFGSFRVAVSNSFGVVTSKVAKLTVLASDVYSHIVPTGLDTTEGSGAWGTFSNPVHMQEIYQSTEFLPLPVYIKELRFRADSRPSATAITQNLARIAVRLSTTRVNPFQMSKTFAANIGSDEQLVFDGQWEVKTALEGPPNGPKDFDIVLSLQQPFYYNPSLGNLCIDFRNYGSLPVRFYHDALNNGAASAGNRRPVASAFADFDSDASLATVVTEATSVIKLGYALAAGTAPVVLEGPAAKTINEGADAVFKVRALGSLPMRYQWFFGNEPIEGATSAELLITNASTRSGGLYSVEISNAFGTVKPGSVALGVTPRDALSLVVPASLAAKEGLGASAGLSVKIRLQEMYSASLFPQQPIVIHGVRFRPDITYAVGPFSGTLENIVFRLSTSPRAIENMSRSYEENLGPDVQEVYRGEWTVTTAFAGPAAGPKLFDVQLPFQQPFLYDPRVGNLLLEYRNYSTLPLRFHTDASSGAAGLQAMVFSDGQPDALIGSNPNAAGDVLEVIYTLDDTVPPFFTLEPTGAVAVKGETVKLNAVAAGGSPLSYSWFFDGVMLEGEHSPSLSLQNVSELQQGFYSVAVSNNNGAITSRTAFVKVVNPPASVATVPALSTHIEGDGASPAIGMPMRLHQLYSGSLLPEGPIRITQLRFRLNGSSTSSSGGISTTISNIQFRMSTSQRHVGELSTVFAQNIGSDEVTVFDGDWYLTSRAVDGSDPTHPFDVILPLQQPFVFDSAVGDLLIETKLAQESGRLTVLDAATLPQELERVFAESSTAETGTKGGSIGTVIQIGYENVEAGPTIVRPPSDLEVVYGKAFTLSVRAAGTRPLSYRWRFNGSIIEGASEPNLTVPQANFSHAGIYSVEVSNTFGSQTSGEAILTVKPGPTAVSITKTEASSGGETSVDCLVEAMGGENAVSFSLSFDPALLSFRDFILSPELSSASLNINTTQISSGKLGLAIALPVAERLSRGTVNIGKFAFRSAPISSSTTASIDFGDQPIIREIVDTLAHPLASLFRSGSVTILFRGFEGDVAPRPAGDARLTLGDWVQVGRFVAGLDEPASPEEYQRVDCGPAESAGDGRLTVKDWVQSGRYAAGLDALAVVGGPTSNSFVAPLLGPPMLQGVDVTSISIGEISAQPGESISLPIILRAVGGEAAMGFTLRFDPSVLSFASLEPESGAGGALFNVNPKQSVSGLIGVALALPGGTHFSPGSKPLAKIKFSVLSTKLGSTSVTFADLPVAREVVDSAAKDMPALYGSGLVNVYADAPKIHITLEGADLVLKWPASFSGFVLEASLRLDVPIWKTVDSAPVQDGQNFRVTLPSSASGESYFRLRQ